MNIIAIIIVLGIIVAIHEFGHFVFAKLSHIKVNEFAVGMGPAIAKWKRKETDYTIRALPFGGYCLMEGMAEASDDKDSFSNKPLLSRFFVCLGGPLFNIILAFLLSIILCQYTYNDVPILTAVMEDSAAEEAGMQVGDEIIRLNGKKIYNYREITLYSMMNSPEKPTEFTYLRDGKEYNVTLTKKADENGNYYFGFMSTGFPASKQYPAVKYAAYEVRFQLKTVVCSLKMLFTGKASKDSIMGPVGITNTMSGMLDEAKEETADEGKWMQFKVVLLNLINFAVLLSANLGMMNMLPIPALDGGRILFLLVEAISGRPVPPDKEMVVTAIGVVFMLLLTVFVFFNDISNVIHG